MLKITKLFSLRNNKGIIRYLYDTYTENNMNIVFDDIKHYELLKDAYLGKILRNKTFAHKYIDENNNYIHEVIERDFLAYGNEYKVYVSENDKLSYWDVKLSQLSKEIKDDEILNVMNAILKGKDLSIFDKKLIKKASYRIDKYHLLDGCCNYIEKDEEIYPFKVYTDKLGNKYRLITSKFSFSRYSLYFQAYQKYINWLLWKSDKTHYYRDTIKENYEDIYAELKNIVLYRGIKKAIFAIQCGTFPIKQYNAEIQVDRKGNFVDWKFNNKTRVYTGNIHEVGFMDMFSFISSKCTNIFVRYLRNNYIKNVNNTISKIQEECYDFTDNGNELLNNLQDYTAKLNFDVVEGKIWVKNVIDSIKGSLTGYQLSMVIDIMRGKSLHRYGGNNIERLKTKLFKIGINNHVSYNASESKLDSNHFTTQIIDIVNGKYGFNDIYTTFKDYVQSISVLDNNFDSNVYVKKTERVEYEYKTIKELVSDIEVDKDLHQSIENYRNNPVQVSKPQTQYSSILYKDKKVIKYANGIVDTIDISQDVPKDAILIYESK